MSQSLIQQTFVCYTKHATSPRINRDKMGNRLCPHGATSPGNVTRHWKSDDSRMMEQGHKKPSGKMEHACAQAPLEISLCSCLKTPPSWWKAGALLPSLYPSQVKQAITQSTCPGCSNLPWMCSSCQEMLISPTPHPTLTPTLPKTPSYTFPPPDPQMVDERTLPMQGTTLLPHTRVSRSNITSRSKVT